MNNNTDLSNNINKNVDNTQSENIDLEFSDNDLNELIFKKLRKNNKIISDNIVNNANDNENYQYKQNNNYYINNNNGNNGKKSFKNGYVKEDDSDSDISDIDEDDDDADECIICSELIKLGKNNEVGVLDECKHIFCYKCIKLWSDRTNNCPLCKREFGYIRYINLYDIQYNLQYYHKLNSNYTANSGCSSLSTSTSSSSTLLNSSGTHSHCGTSNTAQDNTGNCISSNNNISLNGKKRVIDLFMNGGDFKLKTYNSDGLENSENNKSSLSVESSKNMDKRETTINRKLRIIRKNKLSRLRKIIRYNDNWFNIIPSEVIKVKSKKLVVENEDENDNGCEICGVDNNWNEMLLCDSCDKGFHMYCLDPPLTSIPETSWFCTHCVDNIIEDATTQRTSRESSRRLNGNNSTFSSGNNDRQRTGTGISSSNVTTNTYATGAGNRNFINNYDSELDEELRNIRINRLNNLIRNRQRNQTLNSSVHSRNRSESIITISDDTDYDSIDIVFNTNFNSNSLGNDNMTHDRNSCSNNTRNNMNNSQTTQNNSYYNDLSYNLLSQIYSGLNSSNLSGGNSSRGVSDGPRTGTSSSRNRKDNKKKKARKKINKKKESSREGRKRKERKSKKAKSNKDSKSKKVRKDRENKRKNKEKKEKKSRLNGKSTSSRSRIDVMDSLERFDRDNRELRDSRDRESYSVSNKKIDEIIKESIDSIDNYLINNISPINFDNIKIPSESISNSSRTKDNHMDVLEGLTNKDIDMLLSDNSSRSSRKNKSYISGENKNLEKREDKQLDKDKEDRKRTSFVYKYSTLLKGEEAANSTSFSKSKSNKSNKDTKNRENSNNNDFNFDFNDDHSSRSKGEGRPTINGSTVRYQF